tara:strand:- start:44156 stop:44920 length:765 start_codon:yes stop_codon:yes gene_type:complete
MPEDPVPKVDYQVIDLGGAWHAEELPRGVDVVIHLAQSNNFRNFPGQAMDVFNINVGSTAKLLDFSCKSGVEKFFYASSGGVYGSGEAIFKEDFPVSPYEKLGYYLASKVCGEALVKSYAEIIQTVVLRPFFIYGQRQNRTMLIPRLVDSIKNKNSISLQGDNGICINPIYVSDAVDAIKSAIKTEKSATFNIAGPEVLSLRDICDIIGRQLGIKPIYEVQNKAPNNLVGDISLMKEALLDPKVRLDEGIRDLI